MLTAPLQPLHASVVSDAAEELPVKEGRRSGASFLAGGGRALGLASCVVLTAVAIAFVAHQDKTTLLPLFLLFTLLALLAVILPASGPRGQRVGLIPSVGLAAVLLLPPSLALLPLLLANTAYAFSRDMPLCRRSAYERGAWLFLAILAGGCLHFFLLAGRAWNTALPLSALGAITLAYGNVYAMGRLLGLGEHFRAEWTVRRHAWSNWRLEAVTLAVTAPVAALMALAYPSLHLAGVAGAASLLALMLVVAHFGFEAALLRDQVRAMEKISAVTVAQTSAAKVAGRFLQLCGGLVSCDRAVLWLTDDSQTRLERMSAAPPRPASAGASESGLADHEAVSVRFGEGLVGRIAERKSPLIVRDGARDPRLTPEEQQRQAPSFSMMLLPLVAGDETMGVVQFERDAPGTFTRREQSRLRALANQTAAILANVRSHQDVYNQAVTDGLTGLYNRRHMQAVLLDERRRAERYGHTLSVIMLDVDSFKAYNDTYGHVQGDVLLKMLAEILRENVRGVDVLGRFGGEEFIIVLPETSAEEAHRTAERLRLAVADTVFPGFADDPELVVFKTISLGVATFPDVTADTQALVTLADNALYRAKRGGRNQTVIAEPEMAMAMEAERETVE